MEHKISLTDEELTSLQELFAWCDENAPRGLPMSPTTRTGRMLLVKLEPVVQKLRDSEQPAVEAEAEAVAAPEPVAPEAPASAAPVAEPVAEASA